MLAKISLCTACQVLLTLFPQKYSLESGVYLYVDKNLPYIKVFMALLAMVIFTHYTAGRSFPIKFLCNKLKVKLQLMHWRLHNQCLLLNISEEIFERKKNNLALLNHCDASRSCEEQSMRFARRNSETTLYSSIQNSQ